MINCWEQSFNYKDWRSADFDLANQSKNAENEEKFDFLEQNGSSLTENISLLSVIVLTVVAMRLVSSCHCYQG